MANFSQKIENKYGVKTYQDTKNTYDWIEKAMRKGAFPALEIQNDLFFDVHGITVSCESMKEFVENAYGQSNYRFISGKISVYTEKNYVAYIAVSSISFEPGIGVYCESKVMLERVVNLLLTTSLNEVEANGQISVTSVTHIEQNNGVVVSGSDNAIANDHSTVMVAKESSPEPKIKKWLKAIGQNLLANGIWYLLCLTIGALVNHILSKV